MNNPDELPEISEQEPIFIANPLKIQLWNQSQQR